MKLILRFLKPHWKLFVITVILLILDVMGALFIPTLAAQMLNLGTSGSSFWYSVDYDSNGFGHYNHTDGADQYDPDDPSGVYGCCPSSGLGNYAQCGSAV